jgi:hypothetical protein
MLRRGRSGLDHEGVGAEAEPAPSTVKTAPSASLSRKGFFKWGRKVSLINSLESRPPFPCSRRMRSQGVVMAYLNPFSARAAAQRAWPRAIAAVVRGDLAVGVDGEPGLAQAVEQAGEELAVLEAAPCQDHAVQAVCSRTLAARAVKARGRS